MSNDLVKIFFPLERDDDGYPPTDVEALWSIPLGDGTFQIDNLPFYVRNLSLGDVVEVSIRNNRYEFDSIKRRSHNSIVRVSPKVGSSKQLILDDLERLGGQFEVGDQ